MKRISAWFDRHPKIRIALQLLLDAAPFLLLVGFGVCVLNIFSYSLELGWLMDVGIFGYFIMTLPLFILGIKWKKSADGEFACYPWCDKVSGVFRTFSVIAVVWEVIMVVFILLGLIPA